MQKEGKMFLYTLVDSLDPVMASLCQSFGLEKVRRTNRLELKNGEIAMTITVMCADMGPQAEEQIKEQTGQLCQSIYQVKTEQTDIKINLLHQIRRTRGIVLIDYSFPKEEAEESEKLVEQTFFGMLRRLQAVIWIPEKEGIYCSANGRKALLLSLDGESEMEEFMPYPGRPMVPADTIHPGQIKRRDQSFQVLREKGIYVPINYPFLESGIQAKIRSPKEIAERAAGLLIVSLYSECMVSENQTRDEALDFVKELMDEMGKNVLSPNEKKYMKSRSPRKSRQIEFSWQYECLAVMEWALGLTPDLGFPNKTCDVSKAVELLKDCHSIEDILKISNPRSKKELLDACDLIFCLDWACTDARIHKLPMPADMDGSVVMERHKAFNWLICSDDNAEWDNVKTHT